MYQLASPSWLFPVPLNQTYKGLCETPVAMRTPYKHGFQAATVPAGNESAMDSELNILRDVFRLLPAGVTVQDERGEFLLANDAATALLQMTAAAPAPS